MVAADRVNALKVTALTGAAAIRAAIPALARLRIAVFREFPYLYDGSPEYEAEYLETYARCADSLIVLVEDGDTAVGASSALPLTAETPDLKQPFVNAGWNPARVLYLRESVLLPAYRGRGLGHAFFDQREAHARRLVGCTHTAFCAVRRDSAPTDAPRSLEGFWRNRGYAPQVGLTTVMHWQEVGQSAQSAHGMQFWTRALEG
jgi:GNAT superfamily N-acetyltransferase